MNKDKIFRPIVNLESDTAKTTTGALNNLLANEYALFTKTLNYHWNITGPRFHSLHTFLEGQYKDLLTVMDDIAERIRIIGETPHSTVKKLAGAMDLSEKNGAGLSSNEMINDLFESNMILQEEIKDITKKEELFKEDPGTEDFLVGLLQKHEMMSWMLKSHLD